MNELRELNDKKDENGNIYSEVVSKLTLPYEQYLIIYHGILVPLVGEFILKIIKEYR